MLKSKNYLCFNFVQEWNKPSFEVTELETLWGC